MFDLVMFGLIAFAATVVLAIASYRAHRQDPPLWIPPTHDPVSRIHPRTYPYDWEDELEELLRDDAEPA